MDRKAVWAVVLFTLFINFAWTAGADSSEPSVLFEKTLSINPWHFHLSYHPFSATGGENGILKLTKLAPVYDIKDGLVTFNGRLIHLRPFCSSDEKVSVIPVTLLEKNNLVVFLWGTPGAAIDLELFSNGTPETRPVIVVFEAEPPTIQRGQSSLLQWQTEHTDRCEIQPGVGSVAPSGSMTVSPTETVQYTLTAWGQGDPATSSVTILMENSGPVAEPQEVVTTEDAPVPIILEGYDIDGDALSFRIESGPSHGVLSGQPPDLIYLPDSNYAGADSFSFTVTDGRVSSAAAVVTIAVQAMNDGPIAHAGQDQTVFVGQLVTLDGSLSKDPEGDALAYRWELASAPSGSSAFLNDPESVQATFTPDKAGQYLVQLSVHDGGIPSEPAMARITANPKMVNVPNVAGLVLADAKASITSAKLSVGPVSESHHEIVAAGHVISQAPPAGTSAEEGGPVSLAVSLGPIKQLPAVAFQAVPSAIEKGSSAVLKWETNLAKKVYIDNGLGAMALSGSFQVSPANSTTYTLTAVGDHGTVSAVATVQVSLSPAPQPEGSFGKLYEDLIPPDASIEQHNPKRFALVTGLVENAQGQPLESAFVTVHGHPEYGTASTDHEGRFSLPVEGGGTLTIAYRKPGHIPAQRQVNVPWNAIAVVERIQMIAEDAAATSVVFNGSAGSVTVHRSTPVTDSFGQRACTVVFTGDNKAYLADKSGNKVLELSTINFRATEYRTPQSMPAKLPPSSAFTWCAELSVDGAERVQFDKPVIVWVDNFLGFPVGEIVPVGYYDRDRAQWLPMKNGLVVRLLDTDSDGIVDALDADDDGQPDDLDANGSVRNEVVGLNDNQRYVAGSTFWRAAVTHFSPIDLNWPPGLPPGATPPNPRGQAFADLQKEAGKDPRQCLGSFLEEKSRIFHEDIPIPGTDLALHYASSRVAGYKPGIITVPASGDTVPESLVRILVKVEVAGRSYVVSLPPEPNQFAQIEWDGLDHLGRRVNDSLMAHVEIGFVYNGVYYVAAVVGDAFGRQGIRPTVIPSRQEVVSWRNGIVPIVRGVGTIAEGWSLSHHHYVSPMDSARLFKGDGTIGMNNIAVIENFAGDGTVGRVFGGMGGPAINAQIGEPYSAVADEQGNLYIATADLVPYSHWNHRILKIDPKGVISQELIAPDGWSGIARDVQGNFYHSYSGYNCVKKLNKQGPISSFGICDTNWGAGFSGDGGPATDARFSFPLGIDIDSSGNVYIADTRNHRIRKVDTNGTITTFAGQGAAASSGDGGQATDAALNNPNDVAADAYGNIFISEEYGRRVRKVDPTGKIITVAGNGTSVFKGNGSPATETGFNDIRSISVDKIGNLYIVSGAGNRVYKVDAGGIVTTVAGAGPIGYGQGGYGGEGGPAAAAILNNPSAVAVDPAGNLYLADQTNNRIRKIGPPSARLAELMEQSDLAFSEENGQAYILSGAGIHKMTVDAATGVVLREFTYDPMNRLIAILDRFGNRTAIERDGNGIPTAVVSPDGMRTGLSINAENQLVRITYPDGRVATFDYSADGLELRKTEPAGNTFTHFYDSHGRLADYTDDEGGHWQLTKRLLENAEVRHEILTAEGGLTTHLDRYALNGTYLSTITDATGAQTTVVESADGLSVSSALACGLNRESIYGLDPQFKYKYLKTLTEQSPSGLKRVTAFEQAYTDMNADSMPEVITRKVTVNGRSSILSHDTVAAKRTSSSPSGRSAVMEYDPNTLLVERVQTPGLLDTNYAYDSRGRLIQMQTGSRAVSFGYNDKGFLGSLADPLGRQTFYEYDAAGRVSGIARPDGGFVDFGYDANDNLTVLVNPAGISHRFGHNQVNHRSSYTTPLSGGYQYRYDRDRRPTETVLPSGRILRNVYDQGRLARTETPEGDIFFNYLCGSKVGSITKGGEGIAYGYDGSLLTSETLSGTLNQAVTYGYANDFELIQASYAGESTGYGYDSDGLLSQAGALSIVRDAGNGLPLEVSGGPFRLSRSFNGYGEIDSQSLAVGGRAVSAISLQRNNAGHIVRKSESAGGAAAIYEYGYDAAGRLLKVFQDGALVEEYQYDETGARIYELNTRREIGGRPYSYSDEDHLLAAGDWTYQYNLDGFLAQKTNSTNPTNKTQYFYSSRGELLAVLLPDGKRIEYACDPLGRRIAKLVNGAVVEKYLWQGMTRLLAVYNGSNSLFMRFEYADERMPVAMTAGGMRYYFGYDQVGSLIAVADGSGSVVKRISYDSFGNILDDSNPGFAVPIGFAGGLHDRDTGLVRFGYRDYDPEVGRWTAKDPIGFAGGDTDLYGYVLNNPINTIDSFGLLTPNWHFGLTYVAARKNGYGIRDSFRLAIGVVAEDRNSIDRSPSAANIHAMAGEISPDRYQSQSEALAGANDIIKNGPLISALHAAQDYPGHYGESMQNFGLNWSTAKHILKDIWPGWAIIEQAYLNTTTILNRGGNCN
jgi:RHS repeat-associated protein